MLSLSCIIRYASNLRKSVEIFENLTLLLEKKTRWFIIRIKRAAVQYLHIDKSGYLIFASGCAKNTAGKEGILKIDFNQCKRRFRGLFKWIDREDAKDKIKNHSHIWGGKKCS